MSAEVSTSESVPRKCLKRKATAQADYGLRAETAQFGELQGELPVGSPKGGDWSEPSGETSAQGVTANPGAATTAHVAEGTESPAEYLWLLMLQAGYTVWWPGWSPVGMAWIGDRVTG